MAKKFNFDAGKFIQDNPYVSLIVLGGLSYLGYSIYRGYKKNRSSSVEESEKNPFNYTVFMQNAETKAKNRRDNIKSYSSADALKYAEKLYETWNDFGFDYPDEAKVIIRNMPSKYDFAKVLIAYKNKYNREYQADIKDRYNEDNYNAVMETALDISADYRK